MHRSIFESLMRTLKGHLLYQAEYLSRLLVKPPEGRSEADVLKLASYLTSLQRFQEVPQPQLVQLAKEVTYAELTAGTLVCKQGQKLTVALTPKLTSSLILQQTCLGQVCHCFEMSWLHLPKMFLSDASCSTSPIHPRSYNKLLSQATSPDINL